MAELDVRSMKRTITSILCCVAINHARADSDWLPPPGGYIWPQPSDVQISDEREVDLDTFPEVYRESILLHFWDQKPVGKVWVREADLNGDGKNEIFLYIPESSGTGGSVYEILSPSKGRLMGIGAIQGGILLCAPAGDWLQIEGSSKAGGGQFTRYLLRFEDGEYREVRNEDHNLINNTVTVRKTEQGAAVNP